MTSKCDGVRVSSSFGGDPEQVAPVFLPGDIVTVADWGGETVVIESVDNRAFPNDPVAFFVGGGFWRVSRLTLVERPPEQPILAEDITEHDGLPELPVVDYEECA